MRGAEGGSLRGYRLQVLGGWNLGLVGVDCTVPLRSQRLIAYLAVAGPSPRAVLCGRLWPDSSEPRALDSLRVTIHRVGHDLPGLLSLHNHVVSLAPAVVVDLDQERVGLAGAGAPDADSGGGYARAGSRFGPEPELLPGWYEDWVLVEQDRLRADRIRHHARRAQGLLDAGELRAAIDAAGRSLGLDPLDEWSLEVLVRAQLGLGAACAARRALLAFRRDLHEEFGQFSSPLLDELDRMVAEPAGAGTPGTTVPATAPGRGAAPVTGPL